MSVRTQIKTYAIPNNAGPSVLSVGLGGASEVAKLEIEAWIGNFGSSNVYILEGEVNLEDAQAMIAKEGKIDVLAALTEAGPVRFPLDPDCRRLTLFFEHKNEAGQVQAVCVKFIETVPV